jgi:hypothetical protein
MMKGCSIVFSFAQMSTYVARNDLSKQQYMAAGPGYTSTHPACRSELSVKPPQSTPMVRMVAFPAA